MNLIVKGLLLNTGLSLFVPAVAWCFDPGVSTYRLIRLFTTSFVYANSVGFLFQLLLGRILIATMMWHPVKAWAVRGAAFFVFTTVGTLLATSILYFFEMTGPFWVFFWDGYRFSLLISAAACVTITIYETLKNRLEATRLQLKQKELERERATALATAATLSSLESRIHPHFLFNTINSISSLIPEDPAKAERLLGKLADLLRFSLDAPQLGLVPLSHEMKIVEDYLEIEKARLGDRLHYQIEWNPLIPHRVPPLSIQTLVENSIKYAIAPKREGGSVTVRIVENGEGFDVQVEDDGPGFSMAVIPGGHGIENTEARLKTMFNGHTGIRIVNRDAGCLVQFTVPQA